MIGMMMKRKYGDKEEKRRTDEREEGGEGK